ncbi:ImmA/IrrE family metallo-endopeptidase [Hymenobacter piscis]|uniref:ImmA/IrrE family metallo-endopeptidase n=1 Tax=Hymenobacter piscis TaxID=2839984 RepID=UPI0037426A7F
MILYNDQHSPERQESDIMHEMAHVLCQHPGDDLQLTSDIGLRDHDAQYEEEASWLGSVLQVPDAGLMWYARRGYSIEQIAARYTASVEMVTYRWRMCGIARRLSYHRA